MAKGVLKKIKPFLRKRQSGARATAQTLNPVHYYRQVIKTRPRLSAETFANDEIAQREQILGLCRKRLSTEMVGLLAELHAESDDCVIRSALARKIHELRRGYLQSHKEYSDRRLIMLAERDNLFDKWEGIYILGCFGGSEALRFARARLQEETDSVLRQALQQAICRIERTQEKKKRERGF